MLIHVDSEAVGDGMLFIAPNIGENILALLQAQVSQSKGHILGLFLNVEQTHSTQRNGLIVFLCGEVGGLEVHDLGNGVDRAAVIVANKIHILAVIGITASLL